LTFEEIEKHRTEIPDERNGARIIERLMSQLDQVGEDRWDVDPLVLMFGRLARQISLFEGIPRYSLEPSREFLKQYRELLEQLAKLRDKPTGRFDLDLATNPFDTLLPHLSPVRTASKLIYLDGTLKLTEGDIEGAADSIQVAARVSATLDEQPTVVGRLVQMATEGLTIRGVENVLRAATVDELRPEILTRLRQVLEDRLGAATMQWALLGERAFFVAFCDGLADGKFNPAQLGGVASTGGVSWLPEMLIRENQMRGVEMLTWLVDAGDDPAALTKAAVRIDTEMPHLPKMQILTNMMVPSLSRAVTLHVRITAALRAAKAALATEQFRIATGSLPDSLEALVPDYLDVVPTDPFDGQPMRFAVTEHGVVIYSIGENLEDDGGSVARQKIRPKLPDVGFRLHKPEHRGLILTDEPPPGDG
jgi:hypothetical protein